MESADHEATPTAWPRGCVTVGCPRYRELSDRLGHDRIGHQMLKALLSNDISTVALLDSLLARATDEELLELLRFGPSRVRRLRTGITDPGKPRVKSAALRKMQAQEEALERLASLPRPKIRTTLPPERRRKT